MFLRSIFHERSSSMRWTLPGIVLLSACSAACARGPSVAVDGLALRRVVIYRNGVGYFERAGHLTADKVNFKVKGEEVGDFLATLAVIERGGSSVRSASFPIKVADKAKPPGEEDDDEIIDEPPTGKKPKPK